MSQTIGHKSWLELVAAEVGPERSVRVLSFQGRSDTGFIPNSMFRAGEPPVAIVNVNTGALVTQYFGGVVNGGISQIGDGDTGTPEPSFAGQTLFAIVTDTGAAGL